MCNVFIEEDFDKLLLCRLHTAGEFLCIFILSVNNNIRTIIYLTFSVAVKV